jgi:riboflavin synthase
MFTGLINEVGIIVNLYPNQEGRVFSIHAKKTSAQVGLGDSVAVNGTCLTVTDISGEQFTVQAVHITLQKTNLNRLIVGSAVNLELALRASDRLGGHFVQGHVNGIGSISRILSLGNNYQLTIIMPVHLQHYMISEGSIALDGISLTIAQVIEQEITVSIIPHTWEATTLHKKNCGDSLNVEVDVIAKYVEQFVRLKAVTKSVMSRDWLQNNGY